jgi:hypothetical protein
MPQKELNQLSLIAGKTGIHFSIFSHLGFSGVINFPL